MARYTGPRARISRRFRSPILGCEKVLKRKNYPPGQHGKKFKKKSDYALQLEEKQKMKYTYGLLEKQLANLVKKVSAKKGVASDLLMQSLELRLDNVVTRLGLGPSHAAARQLVVHRHVKLNGKICDKPAYILQEGDTVTLSEKAKLFTAVQSSLTQQEKSYPWLAWNEEDMTCTIIGLPDRKAIPTEINDKMVIEYYAR